MSLPIIGRLAPGVGKKVIPKIVTGPSSYTAGGFEIDVPEANGVEGGIGFGGGYIAEVLPGSTDKKAKVKVYYADYPATAAGPLREVPDGTDLSGVTFFLLIVSK